MKKTLLLVLFPVVLLVAGALAVWGEEQKAVQPGCGNCAKMQQQMQQQMPCPKAAAIEKGTAAPCANCPNAANLGAPCPSCAKQGADAKPAGCDKCAKGAAMPADCANCPKMKGAEVAPPAAGCSKCAKLQQPDLQPAAQPVQKGCCNKQKVL